MKISFRAGAFPIRSTLSRATVIPAIGLAAIATTGCPGNPQSPFEQSVAELHVKPPVLHMHAGTPALISVHALGEQNGSLYLLPEFVIDTDTGDYMSSSNLVVTWSAVSSTGQSVVSWITCHPNSQNCHRAILTVPAGVGGPLDVRATAGGKEASAKVIVDPSSPPPPTVQAAFVATSIAAPEPHSVRVAVTDSAGVAYRVQAFQWQTDPKSLLVPGTDHVVLLSDFARTSADAAATGAPAPVPSPAELPYVLPVRLWLAEDLLLLESELQAARDRIRDDLALANELFRLNRVGIILDAGGNPGDPPPIEAFTGYVEPANTQLLDCSDLRPKVETLPSLEAALGWKVLHVLYLPSTLVEKRGHECALVGGEKSFVAVFRDWRAPTTLAHEVAHALGLSKHSPWKILDGHTTGYSEYFDPGNLMWSKLEIQQATDRNWLSLGQSIWMTMDSISHLQFAVTHPESPSSPKVRTDSWEDCRVDTLCAPQTLLIEKAQ